MQDPTQARTARLAGGLYATIILCGLTAEVAFRGGLSVPGDPAATAAAIAEGAAGLRAAVLADMVMALADVALAVLLFQLLRGYGQTLALAAASFRLVQAAIIGAALPLLISAVTFAQSGAAAPLAAEALARHGLSYDLGLMFFGVNSVLTGVLVARTGGLGRWLGAGLMAAGAVYLAGSTLRVLSPDLFAAFQAAYLVPVLAETAICVWLLTGGAWRAVQHPKVAATA